MFKAIFSNISNTIKGTNRFTESGTMNLLHDVKVPVETATFGMGCFWGVDSLFGGREGVIRTKVGYGGGKMPNPTYYNIGDHTEITQVEFDPTIVSYENLLELFWKNHEPGARMKTQYCSLILYHSPEQKTLAEKTRDSLKEKSNRGVVTRIEPFDKFYDAEGYHQKYRLQQHSDLMKALGFRKDDENLKTSHVAARVNAYLVGLASVKQFDAEAPKLGFNQETTDYIREYAVKYQGRGMHC
ncbi:peptide methionine sulfoxide reductase-like isoform X2 [Homalodisca vitripennis]|uniref:peptide methionine sulfoxide reductase-like isoform X2 n=1 Tax=Homalodisca vitripennis TaxID=197043 RepID=UPI001EEAD9B4|nr:peptide methionine sulfoxide reductase-like isoform X2 [Homalodisca vitripennis]